MVMLDFSVSVSIGSCHYSNKHGKSLVVEGFEACNDEMHTEYSKYRSYQVPGPRLIHIMILERVNCVVSKRTTRLRYMIIQVQLNTSSPNLTKPSYTRRFTKLLDTRQTLTHAERLEERVPAWG
jgi:hypothetical protein